MILSISSCLKTSHSSSFINLHLKERRWYWNEFINTFYHSGTFFECWDWHFYYVKSPRHFSINSNSIHNLILQRKSKHILAFVRCLSVDGVHSNNIRYPMWCIHKDRQSDLPVEIYIEKWCWTGGLAAMMLNLHPHG